MLRSHEIIVGAVVPALMTFHTKYALQGPHEAHDAVIIEGWEHISCT